MLRLGVVYGNLNEIFSGCPGGAQIKREFCGINYINELSWSALYKNKYRG